MQQWEYLFVTAEMVGYPELTSDTTVWRPRYVNEVEIEHWEQGSLLSEFANHKGREGWELISTNSDNSLGSTFVFRLIFKRAKNIN